jgi:hypothetical protein
MAESRLTRFGDVFLVGRIAEEEARQYARWGDLIDPATLNRCIVPSQAFELLVERCLDRYGEERGLSSQQVEAGKLRSLSARKRR